MDGNRGFSNYCKSSLNTGLHAVRISSFYCELYACNDFCRSEECLEPWRVKHEREPDPVSYGIHDYAMKYKTKHTNSLSSLVKELYHQEGIEIPFSVSKNMCLAKWGEGAKEKEVFSGLSG